MAITLPATFEPTHPTSGLPGYPAIDVFGQPWEAVRAGFWGKVERLSGRPLTGLERPGGPYGLSMYVKNRVNGRTRYLTHFVSLELGVGARVWPGRVLGQIATAPAGSFPGSSHIHMGLNQP